MGDVTSRPTCKASFQGFIDFNFDHVFVDLIRPNPPLTQRGRCRFKGYGLFNHKLTFLKTLLLERCPEITRFD